MLDFLFKKYPFGLEKRSVLRRLIPSAMVILLSTITAVLVIFGFALHRDRAESQEVAKELREWKSDRHNLDSLAIAKVRNELIGRIDTVDKKFSTITKRQEQRLRQLEKVKKPSFRWPYSPNENK